MNLPQVQANVNVGAGTKVRRRRCKTVAGRDLKVRSFEMANQKKDRNKDMNRQGQHGGRQSDQNNRQGGQGGQQSGQRDRQGGQQGGQQQKR